MQLNEQDWNEALERIEHENALLGQRTAQERGGVPRDAPRSDRAMPCMLRVSDHHGSFTVHRVTTRNSGRGGVSILHGDPLDPGEPATLAMQTEGGQGFVAPARVVWCRRIGQVGDSGDVAYEIGFRFASPLAAAA